MLNKKQKVRGTIDNIQANGLGLFMFKKDKVFVKHVLDKEEVEVIITKKLKEGYLGELTRIIKKSSIRTNVKCPYYEKCGGCSYLHMLYPFELKQKTQQVMSLLKKERVSLKVHNCEGMKKPEAYRNKLILSFGADPKRGMISGFYEMSSHRLVKIDYCMMHNKQANDIIKNIKDVFRKCRIDIYNEQSNSGFMKHLVLRQGFQSNELMMTFVCNSREFKGKKKFIQTILDTFPEVTTIIQNVNNRKTSVVLGDEEIVLYGRGYIQDELCGLRFQMSSSSFYQINHEQCEKLYTKALQLAKITKDDIVLDAYCGIGTISLLAAKQAKYVYGVEVNKDAIRNANINKELNDISNVEFVADDATNYIQQLAYAKKQIDVVIMDPAREGSTPEFLQAVLQLKPKRVVYISCNPETQIRDMKELKKEYVANEIFTFDMFPRTSHIESIVVLSRK